jgi:thiamine transport system permease protein
VGRSGYALAAAVPLAFVGIFFAWPVAHMVGLGFTEGLGGFAEVFGRPRTLRIIGQTLAQASLATVICVALGVPIAHVLYRLRFRGQRALRALIIVPFVLPTVVVGLAFRTLFRGTPLDSSFVAILLALVFFNVAVVVRTVGSSWEALDPRQEEAAAALGAGPARVFATVTLRRLLPSVVSAASVVFLFCSTAFGVVLVLGGALFGTIETEIWQLTTQFLDLRAASVLSVTQLAVVVALLAVAAAARGRSVPQKRAARPRPIRRTDAAAISLTLLTAAALMVPLATLLFRSLEVDGVLSLHNYAALATTGARNALVVPVWEALGNSLAMAAAATAIALVVGVLASILLSRTPRSAVGRRALEVLDGTLMLPLGVSAVTVGFGFLITLNTPPFDLRSSAVLVPIAQALIALPLVVRSTLPVLRSVDSRMRESAAVLGASPLRVIRTVDLGLARKPILAAGGFAFAVALGEFGATTFLSRADRPTLPVVIYRLIGVPGGDNLGMALAASVVLAVVTVIVIGAVERLHSNAVGAF